MLPSPGTPNQHTSLGVFHELVIGVAGDTGVMIEMDARPTTPSAAARPPPITDATLRTKLSDREVGHRHWRRCSPPAATCCTSLRLWSVFQPRNAGPFYRQKHILSFFSLCIFDPKCLPNLRDSQPKYHHIWPSKSQNTKNWQTAPTPNQ